MIPHTSFHEKRKKGEYQDPDYKKLESTSKRRHRDVAYNMCMCKNGELPFIATKSRIDASILSREFDIEILCKQDQLSVIDMRLQLAGTLLSRLRFAIAEAYYRNREIISDCDSAPGKSNAEKCGKDMRSLQPTINSSVRNVFGKRQKKCEYIEKDLSGIGFQAFKIEEDRVYLHMRDFDIDQTKNKNMQVSPGSTAVHTTNTVICRELNNPEMIESISNLEETYQELNTARLNNKSKYLLVIGNTSTYTANYKAACIEQNVLGNNIAYKWLLFVHFKDSRLLSSFFIKKVRFYLHHSYRPNNVVDIRTPPFQITRRGWGEFPIRVQIYFHDHFRQKPIQVLHNLVLDRTLSGMHTLGAETLLEIWLRTDVVLKGTKLSIQLPVNEKDQEHCKGKSKIANNLKIPGSATYESTNIYPNNGDISAEVPSDFIKFEPSVMLNNIENISVKSPLKIFRKISPSKSIYNSSTGKNMLSSMKNLNIEHEILNRVDCFHNVIKTQNIFGLRQIGKVLPMTLRDTTGRNISNAMVNDVKDKGKCKDFFMSVAQYPVVKNTDDTKTEEETKLTGNAYATIIGNVDLSGNNQLLTQSSTLDLRNNAFKIKNQVVFQKEGKVFIVDPLQIKLKQDQEKQISLLKLHANFQSEYQKKSNKQLLQSRALQIMMSEHDYTSALANVTFKESNAFNILKVSRSIKPSKFPPKIQDRKKKMYSTNISAFEKQHIQFQHRFFTQSFLSIRSAVDYLLRSLPLILPKSNFVPSFPFVCHSLKDFNSLPLMKQRAYEWLRAKNVTYFIRNHKYLKKLSSYKNERFWTTREVLLYARYHAFTPYLNFFDDVFLSVQPLLLNPLLSPMPVLSSDDSINFITNKLQHRNESNIFLNRAEPETNLFRFESITPLCRISSWLYTTSRKVKLDEIYAKHGEVIDIVNIPKDLIRDSNQCIQLNTEYKSSNTDFHYQHYLTTPEYLSKSSLLVNGICSDINIKILPGIVEPDISLPSAHALMAQCLNLFVENIIRYTVALERNETISQTLNITIHDIFKTLLSRGEFDFLTNKHLGTY